jgi:hypothetical protein
MTLIEHWNGAAWQVVDSPNPGTMENVLNGVRALSSSNIWAVGSYATGVSERTLVEHWNGRTWKQVISPSPGIKNQLAAVRSVSASNAWAVGTSSKGAAVKTLIEHWNGHTWTKVSSPSPGSENELTGVTATSASDVWAAQRVRGRLRALCRAEASREQLFDAFLTELCAPGPPSPTGCS